MIFLVLFITSLLLYLFSAIMYLLQWFSGFRNARRFAMVALSAVIVLQLGIMFGRLVLFGYPFYSLREFLMIYPLALAVLLLFVERRFGYTLLGVMIAPLGASFLLFTFSLPEAHSELLPMLQSPILMIHVSFFLSAYAALTLAFSAAISYLLQERSLKKKRLAWRLPPLQIMDQLGSQLILIGTVLMGIAIPLGSYWAMNAWGVAWVWEPKQIMSLVTLAIYSGYFVMRFSAQWPGRKLAWLTIIGFVSIFITFFGADLLAANSAHSFLF